MTTPLPASGASAGLLFDARFRLGIARAAGLSIPRQVATILLIAFLTYSAIRVGLHASKDMLGDWGVYYRAGIAMREHRPIYTLEEGPMLTFKNAPIIAVAAETLSMVPVTAARILFLASDFIVLAALMAMVSRLAAYVPVSKWVPAWIALVSLVLVLPYLMLQLYTGQTTVIFLGFTVLAFYLAVHDRPWAAGAALAIAICLKVVPLCFVPYLLFTPRPRQALASLLLSLAALLALPALSVGWDSNATLIAQWPAHLRDTEIPSQAWRLQNQSMFAEMARTLSSTGYHINVVSWDIHSVRFAWLGLSILSAAVLYAFVYKTRQNPWARATHLALLIIYMTIFNPLAWRYNYLALAVPYVVVLTALCHSPRDRLTWVLLASAVVLTFTPYHAQIYGARLAGAMMLMAAVIRSFQRASRLRDAGDLLVPRVSDTSRSAC
ncbi:glycosyltransferase family 87 protein [Humisphaera borealis]|uniref:DUF2029 domain-containing protein n=1 Tax=Humisphaera borealis TaxID=2807512 RepID=A0A7M2WV69_9BACT|nr:glycosyltransferase family 87 protein [Humisphaera borealis]QOV89385.1 DUF2029 domain-containing protein [Humisphaera borealis]